MRQEQGRYDWNGVLGVACPEQASFEGAGNVPVSYAEVVVKTSGQADCRSIRRMGSEGVVLALKCGHFGGKVEVGVVGSAVCPDAPSRREAHRQNVGILVAGIALPVPELMTARTTGCEPKGRILRAGCVLC